MYPCVGCALRSGRGCGLSQVALCGEVLQDALGLLVGAGFRRRFLKELSCGSAMGRAAVEHAVGRLPVMPPVFASCSSAWSQKASRATACAIDYEGLLLPRSEAAFGVPSSGVVLLGTVCPPRSLWISLLVSLPLSRSFPCWCPPSSLRVLRLPALVVFWEEVDGRRLLVPLEQRVHDVLLVQRDHLGFLVEMACCPSLLLGHPSCKGGEHRRGQGQARSLRGPSAGPREPNTSAGGLKPPTRSPG